MIDAQELAKQVSESMNKLMKINDQLIKNLPVEQMEKLAPIQADIHQVLRLAKKGDINKINEIKQKYADTNSI
jgi:hypothetical protein